MRKIHIFYSHYNVEGNNGKARPEWFDYEKCFINLINTIATRDDVNLHVVMDGKIEDNWIKKYKDYFTGHEIVGGDMIKVTLALYKIVKEYECSPDDLIYILENDYLHLGKWVDEVQTLYCEFANLNYVSLYDHGDKYFLTAYDDLVSKIWATTTLHWRSTPSTCGSYITTKSMFDMDYSDHTGVTVPIGDHHKWLYLNQSKGRFIITPVPGLSTHCMEGLLSPTIDWAKL